MLLLQRSAIASALASLEHTGSQKKFENEICRHFLHRKAAAEAGFVLASSSNWTPQPRQRRVALDAGATAWCTTCPWTCTT